MPLYILLGLRLLISQAQSSHNDSFKLNWDMESLDFRISFSREGGNHIRFVCYHSWHGRLLYDCARDEKAISGQKLPLTRDYTRKGEKHVTNVPCLDWDWRQESFLFHGEIYQYLYINKEQNHSIGYVTQNMCINLEFILYSAIIH